MEAKTQV